MHDDTGGCRDCRRDCCWPGQQHSTVVRGAVRTSKTALFLCFVTIPTISLLPRHLLLTTVAPWIARATFLQIIDYQRTILSAGETAVSRGNALSLLSDIGAVLALLVLRPGIDLTREIWGPVHNSPVRWGVELAPAAISLLTIASRPRSLATLSGVQPWMV